MSSRSATSPIADPLLSCCALDRPTLSNPAFFPKLIQMSGNAALSQSMHRRRHVGINRLHNRPQVMSASTPSLKDIRLAGDPMIEILLNPGLRVSHDRT